MQPKIAYFCYRSHPCVGGVELQVKLVSEYMSKFYDVDVLTFNSASNDEVSSIQFSWPLYKKRLSDPSLTKIEHIDGVNYFRTPMKFRFYSYNYAPELYSYFEYCCKKGVYQLVHLHNLNVYNNYRLAKIAHQYNIPVILTVHDIEVPPQLPLGAKLGKVILDNLFIKKLKKYVTQFWIATGDQRIELHRLGIPDDQIVEQTIGFDENKYSELIDDVDILKLYYLKSKDYFISVGRLDYYKGIDDIIQAANSIPDKKFVIVGEGVIKGPLPNNVIITGKLNNNVTGVLIKHAKLFLFPSKRESWGIVVREAQCLGVPVLAYNIPNTRTLIRSGEDGFIAKDLDEFLKVINDLKDEDLSWFEPYTKLNAATSASAIKLKEIKKRYEAILCKPN
jgi:glycosyltransferase involved in cell wall biosynthesis